ncbi:MAG: peptidoglycan-binding domain-containing protein [Pseudomonadota bacterium]
MLVLTPVAASAQSDAQSAAVESLGTRPCSALIAAQTEDETLYGAFGVWIGGYLTAANAYEDSTFDLTPWQPVELATAQIAVACKQQEDATIAAVTASYVKFLKDQRLTEKSELLRLRAGDQAMFIYVSVLADIRARLEAQGLTITDPEGEFGASFGRVLQRYQRENNLAETGLPDTRTLILLYR